MDIQITVTDHYESEKNKKVIGMMKDELDEKVNTELYVKLYAYRKIDKKLENKRWKGTKKCIVTESLTFDDYKASLFDGKIIRREQILLENNKHELYTINKYKIY